MMDFTSFFEVIDWKEFVAIKNKKRAMPPIKQRLHIVIGTGSEIYFPNAPEELITRMDNQS